MDRIGTPDDFGAPSEKGGYDYRRGYDSHSPRKLYRSRSQNVISGVCGGIAEYFDIDVSLVRIISVLLVIPGGMSLWIYIILWIAIPLRPIDKYSYDSYGYRKRR